MRYFIGLSFNGAPFSGWQIQKNANSVQAEIQNALSTLLKEPISVVGAGRTDAGVNAINYIAHFDYHNSSSLLPCSEQIDISSINSNSAFSNVHSDCQNAQKAEFFLYKINAILPKEITVNSIFSVDDDLHARFSAKSRTYNYFLHTNKDPFNNAFSYYFPYGKLDIRKMNKAARFLLGEHDFASLQKSHTDVKTTICTITEAFWQPVGFQTITNNHPSNEYLSESILGVAPDVQPIFANSHFPDIADSDNAYRNITRYIFTVTANRFLRNMVRAMVGTLLDIGLGKKEPEWILELLESKNRSKAGNSVPGNALFLTKILY